MSAFPVSYSNIDYSAVQFADFSRVQYFQQSDPEDDFGEGQGDDQGRNCSSIQLLEPTELT